MQDGNKNDDGPQGRAQWLEVRRSGIGGSDAAAVVGLSRFKTPLALYHEKRGELEVELPDSAGMYWGRALEPLIRQHYANATGRVVTLPGLMRHPLHAFMIGNLDGLVLEGDGDGERVLEVKTARTAQGWGDEGTTLIPQAYLLQVQHYMIVAGVALADVAVLIGGSDFRVYTIPADVELQGLLIDAEREFWHRVKAGEPPDPVTIEDMRETFGRSRATGIVRADERMLAVVHRLHEIQKDIVALERAQDEARAEVMRVLADRADTLTDAEGHPLVTWRLAAGAKRIDAEALRAAHPDIAAQFTRQGEGSRRFLLKEVPQ